MRPLFKGVLMTLGMDVCACVPARARVNARMQMCVRGQTSASSVCKKLMRVICFKAKPPLFSAK